MPLRLLRRSISNRALVVLLLVVVSGCGGQGISDELRTEGTSAIASRAVAAGLSLTVDDTECIADAMGREQLTELVAESADPASQDPDAQQSAPVGAEAPEPVNSLVEAMVACVGTERLGPAVLRPVAPSAADESLSCIADRLDGAWFDRLVTDRFIDQSAPGAALDLQMGTALATCLTPTELLEASG